MALEDIGVRVIIAGLSEFRRGISTARGDIGGLESQIRNLSGTGATVGQNLQKVGDTVIGLGRTMTLALTVPLAAVTGGLLQAGIKFEDTFAGISKTVDGVAVGFDEIKAAAQRDLGITVTSMEEARKAASDLGIGFGDLTPQGQALRDEFRQLALDIPISTNELNRLGEVVGQLGVNAADLSEVTRTVAELGVATDIAAEDAAFALVKLFNVTQEEGADIVDFMKRAGSTIVALGNNSAATEGEILNFATRIAAAGERAKFSEAELFAWSTTLADVGARAELGGTAVSRAINEMVLAVQTGDESLETFAAVSGQTVDQFVQAFEKDASGALLNFIDGLKTGIEQGRVTKDMLNEVGLGGVRAIDIIGRLGEAQGRFATNLETAAKAWAESIALQEEAEKRFATISSQIQLLKNSLTDLGITLFDLVKDDLREFIQNIRDLIARFKDLPQSIQKNILKFVAFATALGPILIGVGFLIKAFGVLATIIAALGTPLGAVVLAVGAIALTAGTLIGWENVWKGISDTIQTVIDLARQASGVITPTPTGGAAGAGQFARKNEGPAQAVRDANPELTKFLNTSKEIVDFWLTNIRTLAQPFIEFGKSFLEGFAPFLDTIGGRLSAINEQFAAVGETLKPLGEALDHLFEVLGMDTEFAALGEAIGSGFGATLTILLNAIANALLIIATVIPIITNAINNAAGLLDQVQIIVDTLKVKFEALVASVLPTLSGLWEQIGLIATGVFNNMLLGLSLFVSNGIAQFGSLKDQVGIIFAAIGGVIKSSIDSAVAIVKTKFEEMKAVINESGQAVMDKVNAIGGAFSSFAAKAVAAVQAVIAKIKAMVAAAAAALAGLTGSPELKIQHPFETFEKYMKTTDFGAIAEKSMSMPTLMANVGAMMPQPSTVSGGTSVSKSVSFGDFNNTPVQTEDQMVDVILRAIRIGEVAAGA